MCILYLKTQQVEVPLTAHYWFLVRSFAEPQRTRQTGNKQAKIWRRYARSQTGTLCDPEGRQNKGPLVKGTITNDLLYFNFYFLFYYHLKNAIECVYVCMYVFVTTATSSHWLRRCCILVQRRILIRTCAISYAAHFLGCWAPVRFPCQTRLTNPMAPRIVQIYYLWIPLV